MAFPGFNNKKHSSIGGDFDGDGVKNRRDCQPMNFRKQGHEHEKKRLEERLNKNVINTREKKFNSEEDWKNYIDSKNAMTKFLMEKS